MVDADRFVYGTYVDVRLLVGTLLGGVAISWWAGFVSFLDGIGTQVVTAVVSTGERAANIVTLAVGTPTTALDAAWAETTAFVVSLGGVLGPFVYPAAILVTVGTMWLVDLALRQMGVL